MKENKFLQWLSGNTNSIYWHDSAIISELEVALKNGACGMTTNPFLVNATLKAMPEYWADKIPGVSREIKGNECAIEWICQVTGYLAKQMLPKRAEGFGRGYVCAQNNTIFPGDVEKTIETAKRYAACGENIVIKMPATRAGIVAIEECAALGLNVAATVSFTVPQVLAVGEAAARGKARAKAKGIAPGLSIAVLMVGRLDDYLRDVAHDSFPNVREGDIINAGTACIKRAYGIFNENGWDTFLMPAGCRGANHIVDLAGAKMIMSIAPKIATLLQPVDKFEERIDVPVDKAVIDRLMTMPEFRKAYEPDGMKPEEFITFGSSNRTTDQFINDGWNPLAAFNY